VTSTVAGLTHSSAAARRIIPSRLCRRMTPPCSLIRAARRWSGPGRTSSTGTAIGDRNARRIRRIGRSIAWCWARTASDAFMFESVEWPTIRFEYASMIAQRQNVPSSVRCPVMSLSHRVFGRYAVDFRSTRLSWTAGPGLPRSPSSSRTPRRGGRACPAGRRGSRELERWASIGARVEGNGPLATG